MNPSGKRSFASRSNHAWGVPLPIFYGENGEPIITPETTEHVAKLFAEFGSKVWFEREAKDLLPEGFTHPETIVVLHGKLLVF